LHGVSAPEAWRIKDHVGVDVSEAYEPILSDERLLALLGERAPWFEANVDEINWRILVRFERRLATAFGQHRVWLAGDAAHATGPLGMQSMNIGFREARDLAEIIAKVLHGGASLEALDCYNRERRTEWQHLLGLAGGDRRNRLALCLPASGERLASLVEQLNPGIG
jgi:2-polyprenyl-6-methoxyphenol hydroxylase-like FAD-dependent oxidoreductase